MFLPDYPSHLQQLIQAALTAANPAQAVQKALRRDGDTLIVGEQRYAPRRVFLLAVGKAAEKMIAAACPILGDKLHEGILIYKRGHSLPPLPPAIRCFPADHPVPTQDNLTATQTVLEWLGQATVHDLVLCLISGGTSALLTQPLLPLADWQTLTQAMLASGCPIEQFNQVRQFFDPVKGGGLAAAAAPAPCASLIISDVVGNPLDIIGSGPTVPVNRDAGSVHHILDHYQVWARLTPQTQTLIQAILGHSPQKATRPNEIHLPGFVSLPGAPLRAYDSAPSLYNHVVADGSSMAQAVALKARQLGFQPQLLTTHLQGEAKEIGKVAAALAQDARPRLCLILAGETTVTLTPDAGKGGRNQEIALSAAVQLAGTEGVVLAAFASDGEDGPTDAAGAMVTGRTVWQGRQHGLLARDYLARHDSYTFFRQLQNAAATPLAGRLIHTGPTGTNVNDLIIILSYKQNEQLPIPSIIR